MANPWKITLAFQDRENTGWTETFYDITSTTSVGAMASASVLWKKRVQLLGNGVRAPWIKVNLVGSPRVFKVDQTTEPDTDQGTGDIYYNQDYAGTSSDFSWATLLCRKTCGDISSGALYLSGCPDFTQLTTNKDILEASFVRVFKSFVGTLTGGVYGMWVQNNNDTTNPAKKITDISVALGANIITVPGHGFVNGDRVRISGVKATPTSTPPPKGVYTVALTDVNSIALREWDGTGFKYEAGGSLRKQTKVALQVTECEQVKFTSHKRGSSLFGRRGRRRTRS